MGTPERVAFTSGIPGGLSAPAAISAVDATPSGGKTAAATLTVGDQHRIAATLCVLLGDLDLDTDRAHGPTLVVIGADVLTGRPAAILLESHDGEDGDATSLIGPLVEQGLSVVVLTADPDPAVDERCLAEGAIAVLVKGHTTRAAMRETVTEMSAELRTPHIVKRGAQTPELKAERSRRLDLSKRLDRLTPRESDVLRLIGEGLSAAEIAKESFVSLATVRSQIRSLLAKVGVNSQIAVVAAAHHDGWFDRAGDDSSISSIVAM